MKQTPLIAVVCGHWCCCRGVLCLGRCSLLAPIAQPSTIVAILANVTQSRLSFQNP